MVIQMSNWVNTEKNKKKKKNKKKNKKKTFCAFFILWLNIQNFINISSFPPVWDVPDGTVVKNLPANADERDMDSIPGSGRSPEVGNGNPLQLSCLGNPMDRGAWLAILHRVTKELEAT